jgi:hypothetical protein
MSECDAANTLGTEDPTDVPTTFPQTSIPPLTASNLLTVTDPNPGMMHLLLCLIDAIIFLYFFVVWRNNSQLRSVR